MTTQVSRRSSGCHPAAQDNKDRRRPSVGHGTRRIIRQVGRFGEHAGEKRSADVSCVMVEIGDPVSGKRAAAMALD